jgi:4-hydroxybenzoate polyprenyltransferase
VDGGKIALEWLRRVFIPQTKPIDPNEWRLLVIDGHHTHTTIAFMWECFTNQIYIVFLPAHTSHVLQPLDVAVFRPLKRAFQKQLHSLNAHDSSTVMAKRRFLYCYHKAREEALTASNICSGWRATGLWPVNRARGLSSNHILENRQRKDDFKDSGAGNSFIDENGTMQSLSRVPELIFQTSKQSRELRSLVHLYAREKHSSPTQRELFRKIIKAYDQKEFDLTMSSRKNEELTSQIEASRAFRKKKVIIDPNAVFADIEAIRKAKIEAGEVSPNSDASDDSSTRTREGSVIVVAGN